MKKMTLRLVMLVMAALLACAPALAEVDAFTSASVTDFYGDNALTGDELMNAINSFSGFYLVCTTNPDGSANAGYFIYGCAELDGKYYLKMGLAENQSRQNLLTNGEGLAVYAATPAGGEEDELYAVSGARDAFHRRDRCRGSGCAGDRGGRLHHPVRDHRNQVPGLIPRLWAWTADGCVSGPFGWRGGGAPPLPRIASAKTLTAAAQGL